ncbi:MAG: type II toxin-antitoxin system RelE/ParE family toxin [Terracidiphilus sp.]
MKVRWTIPAADQLREIFGYVAADNPAAAARTARRIQSAIQQTARIPGAGRIGRVVGTREIVVPGTSYIVAYRLVRDALHVLAILHGAREWPQSF